jgi:hypothetical protein
LNLRNKKKGGAKECGMKGGFLCSFFGDWKKRMESRERRIEKRE